MAGIMERNKMKNELTAVGYSLRYIDTAKPKTRLYRHKAAYNVDGMVSDEVGTYIDNVPGGPEYALKKAKLGQFPWPPSEGCSCKWCLGRRGPDEVATRHMGSTVEATEGMQPPSVSPTASEGRGSKKFGPHLEQS